MQKKKILSRNKLYRNKNGIFLCSRVRASGISVNNCPTICDYIQFYYIFCKQLYVFWVVPSSIIRNTLNL